MTAPDDKARARLTRHREMLGVACVVIGLSFLLEVRAEDRVAVAGLPQYPLPHACLSWSWFGVKCPGCGLTRSFIHLAHGHWRESFHMHRLGWLLALAVLLQIPYRLLALRHPDRDLLGPRFTLNFGYTLIALLIGNWLFEMLG